MAHVDIKVTGTPAQRVDLSPTGPPFADRNTTKYAAVVINFSLNSVPQGPGTLTWTISCELRDNQQPDFVVWRGTLQRDFPLPVPPSSPPASSTPTSSSQPPRP